MHITTSPFDDDTLHEECGVFGIYDVSDAAAHAALGLHALQHRGQEAAGIVSCDSGEFHSHHDFGHVGDIFNSEETINNLPGSSAIGHVRYSTAGKKEAKNCQPIYAEYNFGGLAIAHNGNLTNALTLRSELISKGAIFKSSMDTESIVHLVARSTLSSYEDRIVDALKDVEGAYSLVALHSNSLIAVRDPSGIRPLVLGRLGEAYVVASESCAFDIIGADFVRDIEPGEMLVISELGVKSYKPFAVKPSKFCIFEYVYFSRPDSFFGNQYVYEVRKKIGKILAEESKVEADVVVPVPDSGVPSAMGFAEESNIPFEFGIIRNHYVGRTFIEPTDSVRHLGVKLKHNANSAVLKGKRVILVDDSIVRGTTSKKIVNMVRQAGASEVHMYIASPPTTNSCFYGVDTPNKDSLLASKYSIEEMCDFIEADSLHFISLAGLYKSVGKASRDNNNPQFCDACFSGDYPIKLIDKEREELPLLTNSKNK